MKSLAIVNGSALVVSLVWGQIALCFTLVLLAWRDLCGFSFQVCPFYFYQSYLAVLYSILCDLIRQVSLPVHLSLRLSVLLQADVDHHVKEPLA